MAFLLKYSSIFIPLPTNNHHQVTGPSLNKVLQGINLSRKPVISTLPSKGMQTLPAGNHIDCGNFFALFSHQLSLLHFFNLKDFVFKKTCCMLYTDFP